jgi:hypothetical protein
MHRNNKTTNAMERTPFIITTLVAAMLSLGPINAAEPYRMSGPRNEVEMERALEKALNRHMCFPLLDRNRHMTGEVSVSFVVNAEGRIEVIECTSDNTPLKEYVLRKLSQIDIGDNKAGIWKTTHMRFVFRPEAD